MKISMLVKLCTMAALVAIVFGAYSSSSYGQEASTTDGTIAPASPPRSNLACGAFCNAGKGYKIGEAIVLSGDYHISNIALGYEALFSNTTGDANAASGQYALYSNTTGSYNTASGRKAPNP